VYLVYRDSGCSFKKRPCGTSAVGEEVGPRQRRSACSERATNNRCSSSEVKKNWIRFSLLCAGREPPSRACAEVQGTFPRRIDATRRFDDGMSHRKVGKAGRDRHALVRCRPDSSRLLDIIMVGVDAASGSGVQRSSLLTPSLSSSSSHPMDGKASSPSHAVDEIEANTAARSNVEEQADVDEAVEPVLVVVQRLLFESNDPVLRRRLWGRSKASVAGVRDIMLADGAVACWLAHMLMLMLMLDGGVATGSEEHKFV
jgi:hypothetical protein